MTSNTQLIFSNDNSVIQYVGDMPYLGQRSLGFDTTLEFKVTANTDGKTATIEVAKKNAKGGYLATAKVSIKVDEDTSGKLLEYASILAADMEANARIIPLEAGE